jgi:TetR/AcrR family transcriptional regulator, cholesterol catabolism regulator
MKTVLPGTIAGSASTRDRLLQSAASLFRARGYAGATTRELASSLGMQSASLYHHMGKKEDLLFELSVSALETITTRVSAAVLAAEPADRLRELIRAHLNAALAHQDAHAVMLMELRALSSERRAAVLGLRRAYQALVERTLAEGQASDAIRADMPARQLALGLLNLLNWTIFWYRPDGELSPESLADLLVRIFIEGAATRPART